MLKQITRRESLEFGLGATTLLALRDWALPALAEGETLVPFTDLPAKVEFVRPPDRRTLDIRRIDGPLTPADQFFTTQHYGHPTIDPAAFRLKISGLVEHPLSLTLDELRGMHGVDLNVGFECS